jgi:riboflavin kinase/FMN adenylyltransferase
MKIIYGINKIEEFKKPVLAMGVFDGVHRGHKKILKAAVEKARKIRGTSIALTFWPHPQKEGNLYSLEHRLRLIAELGIDLCIVVNFSRNFAEIKAQDFIKDILVDKICAEYIYVGNDFKFGKNAEGDLVLLDNLGRIYGFKAKGLKIIKSGSKPVSSTLIRSLVKKGEIRKAQGLLHRPVSILGTVIRGTTLGRILGFPTANIDPHHEVIPATGIYAVKVVLGKNKLKGVCYIGIRPTIKTRGRFYFSKNRTVPIVLKNNKVNVEVYIFNFKKNIYGKYLEIQFVKKIRSDRKFPSLTLLANQIKKDVASAKKILS